MAITAFIDPFGSMVQGYKEGQQTELQRQAAKRAMRDSDYDYGLRQIRDPMETRMLGTQVNRALLDYLTARDQNPIQTSLLRERQAEAERMNAEAAMTQAARIRNVNLQPEVTQAGINAQVAETSRIPLINELTREQINQAAREGRLWDFSVSPMMQSPEVGIPALAQRFINSGADPNVALQMAQAHWSASRITPSGMTQPQPNQYGGITPDQLTSGVRSQEYSDIFNAIRSQYGNLSTDQIAALAQIEFSKKHGGYGYRTQLAPDGSMIPQQDQGVVTTPVQEPQAAVTMPGLNQVTNDKYKALYDEMYQSNPSAFSTSDANAINQMVGAEFARRYPGESPFVPRAPQTPVLDIVRPAPAPAPAPAAAPPAPANAPPENQQQQSSSPARTTAKNASSVNF